MNTFSARVALIAASVAACVGWVSAASADWHPVWSLQLPARKSAWEYTPRIARDGYEPVAAGNLVFVGCEHNGALLALDAATGAEKWRWYTGAPIRFAPAADARRVIVGSDDGYLYCLDHAGKLLWKFRGGPDERKVIGHERMISARPFGTAPALADGKVFVVAGYWPVEGIFAYALDAATGAAVWHQDAARFRPGGTIRVVDGRVAVPGHNGNGLFDAAGGAVVTEKPTKTEKKAEKSAPMPPAPLPGVEGNVTWRHSSGERLVAATAQGRIYCFADKPVAAGKTSSPPVALAGRDTTAAEALLAAAGLREGWALVVGLRDGALVEGLLRTSNLHVVAVEADAARADLVRRSLDGRGLFDTHRLSVFTAGAAEAGLPPYFASLICSETDGALPEAALRSLRPYGGVAAARIDGRLNLHRRDGPLPGSADWIHEFVDEGNTLASRDKLVKAPLGLLWYGGPAADTRLYFDGEIDHQSGHGLNPQPSPAQIIEGRMILHGPGVMAAFDIYTGRKLWETPLPKVYTFGGAGGGLGIHSKNHSKPWEHPEALKFEVPPAHRCRASGFDYVSVADGVYIGAATKCIRLNPADGKVLSEWKVPLPGGEMLCWGALRVNGDLLIAAAFRPQDLIDAQAGHDGNGGDWAGDRMPMKHILVMDRHSGKLLWHRTAVWGFLNRAIAVGNDRLYCADLLLETSHEKFTEAKRPLPKSEPIRIHALDLRTGKELWSRNLDVQIKVLHYSKARDLLVAACRNLVEWKDGAWVDLSKDVRRGTRNRNAVGRMRGIRGADGSTVWEVADAPYFDPHIILDDLIIDRDGITYNLLTGKRHERPSRITGLPETWSFKKSGCNHLVACEGMVTWRTAFYDLAGGGGVMPLKGMDAGCSPTLLPAGGVLSIANFGTHHKRNRMTAMAMVHTPENDLWTTYESSEPPGKAGAAPQPQPIRRIGYNLGAPGDRVSADGVVWLDVGSKTAPGVTVQPADAKWFEFHPSRTGSWIASSGVIGAAEISLPTVTPAPKKPAAAGAARKYTVRLHFVEPEGRKPGERVFSVALEGKVVLTDLDVVKEAGAPNRPLVREIQGVEIAGNLEIRLTAAAGATVLCGVELIAE